MKNIAEFCLEVKKNQKLLKPVSERKRILRLLKSTIESYSEEIQVALNKDLGKSSFESYISEIDFVVHEIDTALKKLERWASPKKVPSSLAFFPVKSFIYPEPFGTVLIIGPWNYPFQLILAPLVGAISAGNCVIIKPSEVSSHTAQVLLRIFSQELSSFVGCILGGVEETTELLNQKFDYIFYTGNAHVGQIVLEKAARFLTPVALELGGKSPCFVFNRNLDLTAKRVIWGKFFNAGQTCVAPDYVLIKKEDVNPFVLYCEKWLRHFYGIQIEKSPDYGKIINEKHFTRLESYLEGQEILLGGDRNLSDLYFSPTIILGKKESKVMKEEIFGPILPLLLVNNFQEGVDYVNSNDRPLACYGFIDDDKTKDKLIEEVISGGMVINDTIIHLSNENLPFGGVGPSGMGSYHGKFSFDLFSHKKAVMKRNFLFENSLRYPPYNGKLKIVRKLLSIFN